MNRDDSIKTRYRLQANTVRFFLLEPLMSLTKNDVENNILSSNKVFMSLAVLKYQISFSKWITQATKKEKA